MHTKYPPKKHTPKPQPAPPSPRATPAQLWRCFLLTLPSRAVLRLPALQGLTFYERLFTPLVTLWYFLFQWLHADHTLDAVLTNAQAGGADRLNPKLSANLTSASTGPYSDARQRLPEAFLAQALRLQGERIARQSPTTLWQGFIVALLDGSTVRLRPLGNIPEQFPPHGNQARRPPYWCLMRVVVAFCAFSGAALDCALGSCHLSEQALSGEIILRMVGHYLLLGDRNFGVFRIVQAARHAGQQALVRLTDVRAVKLLGGALRNGDFAVQWQPTRHDKRQPGCAQDPVSGRLILQRLERPGFRPQWLCLFTTLSDSAQYPAAALVQLYGQRWQIELNLRYVKTQMQAAQLEVRSAAMARKQWLACLLAYNLIRAAMLCAALKHGAPPLTLSFSACRRRLESWLCKLAGAGPKLLASWGGLLARLAQCKRPKRQQPRPSEPRAKRHIRESFPRLVGSRDLARQKLEKRAAKS